MSNVSRRDLIAGGAALAGAAMAAAAVPAMADEASAIPAAWDYECDVLIIGYGGAGLWAALTAADEGGVEVLCLEKAPVRGGGNSSINMGEFTWTENPAGVVTYIRNFSHNDLSEEVATAYANELARNIEYCEKWGLEPSVQGGTRASGFSSSCEYPYLDTEGAMRICSLSQEGGIGGWAVLDAARADLGIEVVFSCHDEQLIQNPETKEILGAWTLIGDDETPKAVKARKAVIMTIGGFEFNDDLHRQYLRCYPAKGFFGWPYNTGDGIPMVTAVGAQLWHMNCMIGGCSAYIAEREQPYAFSLSQKTNNYLWVDRLGQRWIDETVFFNPHNGWHKFLDFNEDICDYSRIPTWCIMDQNAIDAGPLGPTADTFIQMGMYLQDLPDEVGKFPGWSLDNSEEIAAGWIKKGETIEELVEVVNAFMAEQVDYEWIGLDPATVAETVAAYNELCATGEDDPVFGRAASDLAPVADGPFYAYPIYPGGCSTLGGPKKNENGQVLDAYDQPIPRLYAAGCFGNIAGHTYGISGGNNAENMVWGRIAARHAAGLEDWA